MMFSSIQSFIFLIFNFHIVLLGRCKYIGARQYNNKALRKESRVGLRLIRALRIAGNNYCFGLLMCLLL